MKRKHRLLSIYILCCILPVFFALDGLLYWFDPFGIVNMVYAHNTLHTVMTDNPTGYRLLTGTHRLQYYTVTILEDGSRLVPDTSTQAACTVVFIGDSVTWGQGVNDSEAWVNLLARQFSNVHFINAARSDYSAPNIARLQDAYPADAYVWLMIYNDNLVPYEYLGVQSSWLYPPAIRLYFDWLFRRPKQSENREADMAQYWQAVDDITEHNTLIFGLQNDPLVQETAQHYPVHFIPQWTDNVSLVDIHPSQRGNEQIANSALPFVAPFVARICNG